MPLSDADVARYATDGVLAPAGAISADALGDMQSELDRFLGDFRWPNADFVPNIVDRVPEWRRFATMPELLDPVRALIGEDVILWGSGLFCKSADTGRGTPWHQDGQYWPIRPLATVTAWIAIDPVDQGNGCLRVIPGSHQERSLLEHDQNDSPDLVLNQELSPDLWEGTEPLDIVLNPGEFSLHDVYMVHGANPNTSGRRRAGIVFRYMPATSHYDRDLARQQEEEMGLKSMVNRSLFLVSGNNVHPGNDIYPEGDPS
jgi:hypothetical protein